MKSLGRKPGSERLERIRSSPAWSGDRFVNVHPIMAGLCDPNVPMPTLSDFLCGGERRVPIGPLPAQNPLETWKHAPDSGLRATWLGHSTVLIEIDGHRVLTDPVWGQRASPSRFVGPKRFQPVPVPLRSMPDIDLALVSHDHYDHLDYPTIRQLVKRDTPFVTSLGVGAHLEAWGVRPERITEIASMYPSKFNAFPAFCKGTQARWSRRAVVIFATKPIASMPPSRGRAIHSPGVRYVAELRCFQIQSNSSAKPLNRRRPRIRENG